MKEIKIWFTDFWGGMNPEDNYFYNILKDMYDVKIDPRDPDYLFFSVFGRNHQHYQNCKKIFYTGENIAPPMDYCDYAFSFDYIDDERNFRLPHYILYDGYYDLVNKKVDDSMVNRKFCNFIVSNPNCLVRNEFFMRLSEYKKVDSAGKFLNNMGRPLDAFAQNPLKAKVEFQSGYKFSIAFENNAYRPEHPGYTTEKIMEPMTVNSIPIYWGNPEVGKEFNTESFINWYDFNSPGEMVEYIKELDNDDEKYMEKLNKPWFVDNKIPTKLTEESIRNFIKKIFDQ